MVYQILYSFRTFADGSGTDQRTTRSFDDSAGPHRSTDFADGPLTPRKRCRSRKRRLKFPTTFLCTLPLSTFVHCYNGRRAFPSSSERASA